MTIELNNPLLLKTEAYRNGEWVAADSGARLPVTNPATGELITDVAKAGADETKRAIEAAEVAMVTWRQEPAKQRAQVMRRWFDLIMANQEDLDGIIAMARLIGRIQETQAIKNVLAKTPDLNLSIMGEDEILNDFRERATTVYHPCGTCRMGPDIQSAVVNSDLQVFGIEGLRVVDASIFPNITSANTNAPTIMVAHEAARRILNSLKA